jgi:3-dehydrotetronate 4-kinase
MALRQRPRESSHHNMISNFNPTTDMPLLLGSFADDFTGASDLADTLVASDLRTILLIGLPEGGLPAEAADAEAVVFALKTRSIHPSEAVRQSLAAARLLRSAGCRHLYFKYCSTFDSTGAGNIGPVADALLNELEIDFTIFCPAFPKNGRKVFNGYLFVGPVLLSESGMQNHPLTPMTDPNLVRVLQAQTRHRVGLIGFDSVSRGTAAIRAEMLRLRSEGVRHAIVDAVGEDDLAAIGAAALDEGMVLTTGGSGLGGGLALSLRRPAEAHRERTAMKLPKVQGPAAIIAGSCSRATLGQIDHFVRADKPFFRIEIGSLLAGKERVVAQALAWAKPRLGSEPLLIAASEPPSAVAQHQQTHGREQVGHLIETALAEIACGLVGAGVRRLVLAGGETSSAAVERLGVRALRIGPRIDPGVPWTFSLGGDPLALALKSGNFGAPDFFSSAFNKLPN